MTRPLRRHTHVDVENGCYVEIDSHRMYAELTLQVAEVLNEYKWVFNAHDFVLEESDDLVQEVVAKLGTMGKLPGTLHDLQQEIRLAKQAKSAWTPPLRYWHAECGGGGRGRRGVSFVVLCCETVGEVATLEGEP